MRAAILALSAKTYGGDSYIRSLVPALEKYGQEMEFILFVQDECYKSLCSDNGNVEIHLCKFPLSSFGPALLFWEQLILPKYLLRFNVDVVYTAKNQTLFFSSHPCVISIRNMWPFRTVPFKTPILMKVRHFLLKRLTDLSLPKAKRVIAVSRFVFNNLISRGVVPQKIDVIPHGIDDIQETLAENGQDKIFEGKFVASSGKFIPYSNLKTLVRAFCKLKSMGYEGDFLFAGGSCDGNYEVEVKALVRELKMESHIKFLGYVSRIQVLAMMKNCDAFLFTSTLEACPFTLLEAMKTGTPIIASNADPMPEFCGDAAVIVDPNDADAFAAAAYEVVSSKELQESLKLKGKCRAEEFTWERSIKKLVTVLDRAACEY